jgi:hypothetical protein
LLVDEVEEPVLTLHPRRRNFLRAGPRRSCPSTRHRHAGDIASLVQVVQETWLPTDSRASNLGRHSSPPFIPRRFCQACRGLHRPLQQGADRRVTQKL